MNIDEFNLTEDHIKLLRAMYVNWDYDSYDGAPCIDIKRPYGDTNVVLDIAEELGWEIFEDADGERHLSKEQHEEAVRLHMETRTALQIVLCTSSFITGLYRKTNKYNERSWVKVD